MVLDWWAFPLMLKNVSVLSVAMPTLQLYFILAPILSAELTVGGYAAALRDVDGSLFIIFSG